MSTPCMIGIRQKDGIIRAIYCHHDGTPDRVGKLLRNHYGHADRVNLLIDGGDISSLGVLLTPDPHHEHTFYDPQQDVTVYYHRDRLDSWDDCHPEEFPDVLSFTNAIGIDYYYLFDTQINQWMTHIPD